jgi:DNA-binding response OmpR family regulator
MTLTAAPGPAAVTIPVRRILLSSPDPATRAAVRAAVGQTAGGIAIDWTETATPAATAIDAISQGFDLIILDGEAAKLGGAGMARQLADEMADCPPVLLLVARQTDAWLATWSGARSAIIWPADPFDLADAVANALP